MPLPPYDPTYRPSFGPIPTDRQAASRSYTNQDVLDNEQSRNLDVALMDPSTAQYIHPDDPYANEPSADSLIAGAKSTLKKANDFSQSSGLNRINGDRAAEIGQNQAEYNDDPLAQMLAVAPTALKATAKGVVNTLNPMNVARTVLHPMDSTKDLRDAADYAIHTPGAYSSAFLQGLADPEVMGNAAGNAIGTVALAQPGNLARGAGAVTQKVGQGVNAAGQGVAKAAAAVEQMKTGLGPLPGVGALDYLLRGDPKGLALATLPTFAKYGGKAVAATGRGIQATGRGMSALPDALNGLKANVVDAFTPKYEMVPDPNFNPANFAPERPVGPPVNQEAASVRATTEAADKNVANGMSRRQAGQRAGWPLSQSEAENIRHLQQLPPNYPESLGLPEPRTSQDLSMLKKNPNAISMKGLKKSLDAKDATAATYAKEAATGERPTKAGLERGDSWKNYGGNSAKTVERSRLAQERMDARANPATPEPQPGNTAGLDGLIEAIRQLMGARAK
jgi:hypothetical protein